MNVRSPARGNPRGSFDIATCQLSDGEQLADPQLRGRLADLAVVSRSRPAELRHVTENRDAATAFRACGEIAERGPHRNRIRVVGVVDQQAASGELTLLAAPAREVDVDTFRPRQPEHSQRGQAYCDKQAYNFGLAPTSTSH